ncbi:Enolase-phosphatase E1 [Mortierella alpina]|nr:Enolase-phosphatase E1 [Mortierella alpina]
MVLTRSKSNKGADASAPKTPVPAPKTTPAKRKSNVSTAPAAKVPKTDSPSGAENGTSAPASATVAVAEEPLAKATTETAVEASGPADAVALPLAPTASESLTASKPVDVPVAASVEPVAASSEEPSILKSLRPYDLVISDIEGTTTPIVFVKENLFPYVTSKLAEFLKRNWASDEMKANVEALRIQAEKDVAEGLSEAVAIAMESSEVNAEKVQEDVIASIAWQMKADRKIGALKAFQGYMWKEGYANGDLKGVLYEDVVPVFDQWKTEGKKLYIYSSGSVPAQKLLFGHSEKGDLLHYFSGHYDTSIGQKIEAESYSKIVADIGANPERTLFLSDNIHEINAAKKAGLQAVVVDRPGNAPLSDNDRASNIVVTSFSDIPKPL